MTPAEEIQAAATKLRNLATNASNDAGSPTWEARRRWPHDPDHTSTTLRAVNGNKLIHGYTRGRLPGPFVTGPVGDYIAAMDPTIGLALADWLESAAEDAEQIGPDPHALAVARAINTGDQP